MTDQQGPWIFDGRLIILKRWSENIGVERELLSTVPVWIRFPSLHLVQEGDQQGSKSCWSSFVHGGYRRKTSFCKVLLVEAC